MKNSNNKNKKISSSITLLGFIFLIINGIFEYFQTSIDYFEVITVIILFIGILLGFFNS